MRSLRAWIIRLFGLFPNAKREQSLNDEIAAHLQLHIDDNIRAGMTPQQARRDAILKLGGIEPVKEACRDRGSIPFFDALFQDLRFAVRQLAKNPGFTTTAILMLALGMCASIAIFAFVDAALIKPLPYRNPAQLVSFYEATATCPRCGISYPNYVDYKRFNKVFTSIEAYRHAALMLTTPSGTEAANAARVTSGFFRTLGVAPILGRDFLDGEDMKGAPRIVLLSYNTWRERYEGKSDVLGKTITMDGTSHTIVGVLPRGFHFAPIEPADYWTSLQPTDGPCGDRRSCHALRAVARLKEGVSIDSAVANLKTIAFQLAQQYPDSNRGYWASAADLTAIIVGQVRPILLTLLGGAALLLLIASANIAALLLVRSESRRREIAVRTALGASQSRIVRQFTTESLVLVAVGSLLGLTLAAWTIRLLTTLIPSDMLAGMSFLQNLSLNSHVLIFAAILAVLSALLFSITSSLRLSLSGIREGLAEGSRGSAGTTWRRLGSQLVVLELATAVVLLVGAGLLLQSFYRLIHVDTGFQPDRIFTLQMAAPRTYAQKGRSEILEAQILARMAALPGVTSAAIATTLPATDWGPETTLIIDGRPLNGKHNDTPLHGASSRYFETIGAKLLRGRFFTSAEDSSKPAVAIVNESFQKKHFPGEDPVGRQVAYEVSGEKIEIVGVVADVKDGPLDVPNRPVLYVPFIHYVGYYFPVIVRTSSSASVLPEMMAAIHQIDPNILVKQPATMDEVIATTTTAYMHRSSAWLIGGFAVMALLLSAIGLYGTVSYSVSQRNREIGVRMALGADRAAVYRLILTESVRLTVGGIFIGLLCSLGATSLIQKLLFGVQSWDIPTLAAVAVLLGTAALLASFIPAHRAASLNPVETLRAE